MGRTGWGRQLAPPAALEPRPTPGARAADPLGEGDDFGQEEWRMTPVERGPNRPAARCAVLSSRPPGRLLACALLLAGSAVHGCGGDRGAAPSGALQRWSLSDTPAVVIGGADERPGHVLHRVLGAARLGDGRIVVADQGSRELKYYDSEGKHLFDAAGRGNGPGEVRTMDAFSRLRGDSILLWSLGRGLVRFGPGGGYAGMVPGRLSPPGDWSCRLAEGNRHLLPDGSMLLGFKLVTGLTGLSPRHDPCPKPSGPRPPMILGRYDAVAGVFDTIAELPGAETNYDIERRQHAYAKNVVFGAGRDRLYVGDTGSDTILVMSFAGDTLATLPVPFEAVAVPPNAKGKPFKDLEFTRPGATLTLRWWFDYPERYPRYARLVAAPGGGVWVMAYPAAKEPFWPMTLEKTRAFPRLEDGGARWRVLGRDGLPIAELRTPPGFFLLEVGDDDHVLGVSKDELDRLSVELYRIER